MKEKIAILTDSSSAIYAVKHDFDNIFMLNIPCFIGNEIYTDFDIVGDGPFTESLKISTELPRTSQPSSGEIVALYEKIKSLGYTHIIYLALSQKLSGTCQNAFNSKTMVNGIEIICIDSESGLSILASMTLRCAQMVKEGKTYQEIIRNVEEMKKKNGYYLTVNDLTLLKRNGRLSNGNDYASNQVKPIIKLTSDGSLKGIKNARTYKVSIQEIVDLIANEVDQNNGEIHIDYVENEDDKDYAEKIIKEKLPNLEIKYFKLSPTATAHFGLKALGIGFVNR